VPKKAKAEEVALARKVMGGFEPTIDFSAHRDTYEEALRKMIDRKVKGKEIVEPEEPEAPPRVVNLMEALRKSLDRVSREKKRPARPPAASRAKKPSHVAKFPPRRRAS
jgi:DNA end-binding protein Ku